MSRYSAQVQRSIEIKKVATTLFSYLNDYEKNLSISAVIERHERNIQGFDSKQLSLIDITPTDLGKWKSTIKKWLRLTNDFHKQRKYTNFEQWFLSDISVLELEDLKHNYLYLVKYYQWPNQNALVSSIKDSIKMEVITKYNQLKSEYETSK